MTTSRRALILIDVQQDYFGGGPLEIQYPPHAESLPQITHAIDAATAAGIPVVVVQHTMGEDAPGAWPPKSSPTAPARSTSQTRPASPMPARLTTVARGEA